MKLIKLFESIKPKGVECYIESDGGTCLLVNYNYSSIYEDILTDLDIDWDCWDDYWFIENLRNNGIKGSGLAALKKAIEIGKLNNHKMLLMVSDRNNKLKRWYLSTGLVKETKIGWALEVI